MGYQPGDGSVVIEGKTYGLRLTLGALAQISKALNAAGSQELAVKIKQGAPEDITAIAKACLRPMHGEVSLSPAQARQVFTHIAPIFEQAFSQEALNG